jgi:hypothetical protein
VPNGMYALTDYREINHECSAFAPDGLP